MKRIFKPLILKVILVVSATMTFVVTAEALDPAYFSDQSQTGQRRQEIAPVKVDADLYEITLSEGTPILTELLRARVETYKKENNVDKAISDSVIITRILAQDAKRRNQN